MNYTEIFQEQKYVYVPSLVTKEQCENLLTIFREEKGNFIVDTQCEKSLAISHIFDFLLLELLPKMEEITGKKLFPTYTYCRWYLPEEELLIHKDRPSCEYSCTLTVAFKGNQWSIYMGEDLNKENGKEVQMNPGDGVIYKGCELWHWREKYIEGEWHAQIFLHYVDQDGPYAEWKYDKRERLSI